MIEISCPSCHGTFKVAEQYLGRNARCAKCGHRFKIAPATTQSAPPFPWDEIEEELTQVVQPPSSSEKQAPNEPLIVQGTQGKSCIVAEQIIIIRKKRSLFAAQREKALPIRTISSVEVKEPGLMFEGFIQFSIAGGVARDSSFTISGGTFDAAQDENSVVFWGDENNRIALRIKRYVESYREPSTSNSGARSAADELLKFKSLLDQGIISAEEFAEAKRRLLNL